MSNALKPVTPGTLPLSSDVDQLRRAFAGASDVGTLSFAPAQSTPSTPTVTSSGTTGNLNGTYKWVVVVITGWQQSNGSYYVSGFAPTGESASTTITNQSANVGLPLGTGSPVIGRAIYRTTAGGASGSEKFAGIVWDNTTTTWTDNIADGSLGTGMPTSSSNPAAYGTAIPANVPVGNTTGTKLDGYGNAYTLANILNEQYNFNASLQGSRAGWASFLRASGANDPNTFAAVVNNVPRYAPSKFGKGVFIEEGTTNLVENSDFEAVSSGVQLFEDTLLNYTGTTVPAPWTSLGGTWTFGSGGATPTATGSLMVAGNPNWALVGTNNSLTFKVSISLPSSTSGGVIAEIRYYKDASNYYRVWVTGGAINTQKVINGTATTTTTTHTLTLSTQNVLELQIVNNTGTIRGALYDSTGATNLAEADVTDTTLLYGGGRFVIGGDSNNVLFLDAIVTGAFATGWTIGGDSRVAWALTNTNPINGTYSLSAVGVGAGIEGAAESPNLTVSASTTYTASGYLQTNGVGAIDGAYFEADWQNSGTFISKILTSVVTGTNNPQRFSATGTTPSNANQCIFSCVLRDSGVAIFDAVQMEAKAYATSYVRNDSTSGSASRAAESCKLPVSLLNASQGAISLWAYEDGINRQGYIIDTEGHALMLEKYNGNYNVYWNNALIGHTTMSSAGLHHFVVNWNGTTVAFYIDGVCIGSWAAPATLNLASVTNVWVGSVNGGGSLQWNNVMSGLMFYNAVLSDSQIADLYGLTQPAQDAFANPTAWMTGPADSAWIAPTLQNGWTNAGSGNAVAAYRKDATGAVRMKGVIGSGNTAPGTVLFMLPTGYRPSELHQIASTSWTGSATAYASFNVASNGNVVIEAIGGTGSGYSIDLDCVFLAEQ